MKRRQFITFVGGAAVAWPLAARARQPEEARKVGILLLFREGDLQGLAHIAVLEKSLAELGWTEGNVRFDYRWAGGNTALATSLAAELVKSAPDVIIVNGTLPLAAVSKKTTTIPIVFVTVGDPVGQGFVSSLAHPGGNITGLLLLSLG
jgi:putative tryptophan/tyrosine transport system substrate-binding protein